MINTTNNFYTKAPCFGCKDIIGGCKINCSKYKKYEKIHEKERKQFYSLRKNDMDKTYLNAMEKWKQDSKLSQKGRRKVYGKNDSESEEIE